MIHELRIAPSEFCRVLDGSKTFLIRDNVDSFQPGDIVVLREFDFTPINPTAINPKGFTDAQPLTYKVGFVQVIDRGNVCFSLLTMPKEEPEKVGPKARKKGKA